jgi:hypothetical protein
MTFHRCVLPSVTSLGWGVSEEKIKMWKDNGRRTPSDGKSSHCLWQGELKGGKYKVATHYVHAFFVNFWDIFWYQGTILIMLYDHNTHLLSSPVCQSCWADITGTWQNIFTGVLWRQSPLGVCDLKRFLGIMFTKTIIMNFIQKCGDFCKLRLHFL